MMDKITGGMNKKGDVPTTLVFVGALILVITALWSFATYDSRQAKPLQDVDVASNSLNFLENYVYSNVELFMNESINDKTSGDLKEKFKNSAGRHELLVGNTNFFALIRNDKFSLTTEGDVYVLKIDNVYVKVENVDEKAVRTFNVEMRFDEFGNRI